MVLKTDGGRRSCRLLIGAEDLLQPPELVVLLSDAVAVQVHGLFVDAELVVIVGSGREGEALVLDEHGIGVHLIIIGEEQLVTIPVGILRTCDPFKIAVLVVFEAGFGPVLIIDLTLDQLEIAGALGTIILSLTLAQDGAAALGRGDGDFNRQANDVFCNAGGMGPVCAGIGDPGMNIIAAVTRLAGIEELGNVAVGVVGIGKIGALAVSAALKESAVGAGKLREDPGCGALLVGELLAGGQIAKMIGERGSSLEKSSK
jgi:hypothetical protein